MYKSMYPEAGSIPMCCYCMMLNRNMPHPVMPMDNKSMFREEEEFEENRMEPMHQMPNMGNEMPNMSSMGHQMLAMPNMDHPMSGMPNMEHQMPCMPNMKHQMPCMPNMKHQMPGMPNMKYPIPGMPNMGNQMPGMNSMPKKDMEKIESDTEEIVRMFEQQHPDILKRLTDCNMSADEARQYLSMVVEMSLRHHMMY